MKLFDRRHPVEHGMVTYKGMPASVICDFLSRERSRAFYAPGTEFHPYAGGKDLAQLPLEFLAPLDAVVVHVPSDTPAIGIGGRAVLVHDTADGSRPAHSILLGAEIPVCERVCNLGGLPSGRLQFSAVPVKVRGFGTFPAPAFAPVEA